MTEYIDRDKLNKKKKYLFQTQGMPFPKSEYFIKVDDFWSMPVADVIERDRINKAIAEIKEQSYLSYDDNPRRVLDEECVLAILKSI